MVKYFVNKIKTLPQLYDFLKLLRRFVSNKPDPIYEFFKEYSEFYHHNLFFIQIGASDGLRNDPIRELIIKYNWKGILIEPIPFAFNLLKKNYSYLKGHQLQFANIAISSIKSIKNFYTFDDNFLNSISYEEKLNYLRKSSFDKKHVESFIKRTKKGVIKEKKILCTTINDLMKENNLKKEIDLLVIDAEGHEFQIIESIDFLLYAPKAIFFESHNLGDGKSKLFNFLKELGYKIKTFDGDTAATRNI